MKLIPEDLTVDIRGGKLYLASDGKVVDVELAGRHGVFSHGPLPWRDLCYRHLAPALAQFSKPDMSFDDIMASLLGSEPE